MRVFLIISILLTSFTAFAQSSNTSDRVSPEERLPEQCSYAIRLLGVVLKTSYDNAWFSEENELDIDWSFSTRKVTRRLYGDPIEMKYSRTTYVAEIDREHSEALGYPTSAVKSSGSEDDMEMFLGDIETVSSSDLHGKNHGLYLKYHLVEWNLVGYASVSKSEPKVYLKYKKYRLLDNVVNVGGTKYTHKFTFTSSKTDANLYWDIFRSCKKLNPDVVNEVTSEKN